MKQAHVFISGFVQDVGFRRFVKDKGEKLKLSGWVRNLPDGRVEAVLQGNKEKIEKAVVELNKGPFLSEVKGVVVEWEEEEEKFTEFLII